MMLMMGLSKPSQLFRWILRFVPLSVALLLPLLAPAAARAEAFAVKPGSFTVVPSSDQAGAHPDLTTSFAIAQNEAGVLGGSLRNAEVVLPLGFAGYPPAVRTCDPVQLQIEECPVGSQIGTLEVVTYAFVFGKYFVLEGPLFNMAPSPGQTAVYGFSLRFHAGAEVIGSGEIVVSVGPDYRVRARTRDVYGLFTFVRTSLTVWGVPADPSHNGQRGNGFTCKQEGPSEQFVPAEEECTGGNVPANENPVPYLVNPTQCTPEPLAAELRGVESWQGSSAPPQLASIGPFSGCESLKFDPTISVAPEQTQATIPTGYEVDLKVPQSQGAAGLATPDLKDSVVKLPAGVVLSPSAATGLETCSEAQVGLGTEQPVECPEASKLGTVSVITPALTGELKGSLYLGGPAGGARQGPPGTGTIHKS
jgi:hypothetical protein